MCAKPNDIKKPFYIKNDCNFYVCDLEKAGKKGTEPVDNCYEFDPEEGRFSQDVAGDIAVTNEDGYTIHNTVYGWRIGSLKNPKPEMKGINIINDVLKDQKRLTPFYQKDLDYFKNHMGMCVENEMPSVKIENAPSEIKDASFPPALVSNGQNSIPFFTIPKKLKATGDVISQLTKWVDTHEKEQMLIEPSNVVIIYQPKLKEGSKAAKKMTDKVQALASEYVKKGMYAYILSIPNTIYNVETGKLDRKLTRARGSELTVAYVPNSMFGDKKIPPLEGDNIARMNQNNEFVRERAETALNSSGSSVADLAYKKYLTVAGLAYGGMTQY